MSTEKLFYRPAEAQTSLGIGHSLFWQKVKSGEIETRKIGRATVIPAASLKAFAEKIVGQAAA